MSPKRLGTENECTCKTSSKHKLQPHHLVRGCPTTTNLQLYDGNKKLVMGPRRVPDTKTEWLTNCWS
jgi:hypothetical protein